MQPRLSNRLKIIFNNLIPNSDVWDFCCDHGYLGAAAYKSNKFKNIYFVDQVDTIVQKLENRFKKYVYTAAANSKAYFFCEDAKTLQQSITGNICITGVGGLTIIEILHALSKNNFLHADRLILGPHRDDEKLINFMTELNQYKLLKKEEVAEGARLRNIFVFNRITHV
jgi:tRNA (adenine22-N1)-methyltransferase